MSFIFFDLPREIRGMIYRLAADDDPAFSTFEVPCRLPDTMDEIEQYSPDLTKYEKNRMRLTLDRAKALQSALPLFADHPLAFTCGAAFEEYAEECRIVTGRAVPLDAIEVDTVVLSGVRTLDFISGSLNGTNPIPAGHVAPEARYRTSMEVTSIRFHCLGGLEGAGSQLAYLKNFKTLKNLDIDLHTTGPTPDELEWMLHILQRCCHWANEHLKEAVTLQSVCVWWPIYTAHLQKTSTGWSDYAATRALESWDTGLKGKGGIPQLWSLLKARAIAKDMKWKRLRTRHP